VSGWPESSCGDCAESSGSIATLTSRARTVQPRSQTHEPVGSAPRHASAIAAGNCHQHTQVQRYGQPGNHDDDSDANAHAVRPCVMPSRALASPRAS
jgi:hypothetical protein